MGSSCPPPGLPALRHRYSACHGPERVVFSQCLVVCAEKKTGDMIFCRCCLWWEGRLSSLVPKKEVSAKPNKENKFNFTPDSCGKPPLLINPPTADEVCLKNTPPALNGHYTRGCLSLTFSTGLRGKLLAVFEQVAACKNNRNHGSDVSQHLDDSPIYVRVIATYGNLVLS